MESISGTIPANQGAEGTANCGGGKMAVGGGWEAGQFVTPPNTSHPKPDRAAWIGDMNNNTGSPLAVTFYVVCIDVAGSSASALQRSATTPTGAKLTLTRR